MQFLSPEIPLHGIPIYQRIYSSPPSRRRPGFEFRYSFLCTLPLVYNSYNSNPRHAIWAQGQGRSVPLNSPVHGGISDQERRSHVENLVTETTEGVEDGVVEGTGKRSLAVGREGVGSDPLGRRAACHFRISMLTCGIACSIAREIVYVWDSL